MSRGIIVTGCESILGLEVIHSLVAKEKKVTALLQEGADEKMVPPDVPVVKANLFKISPLKAILERFDEVIHCASNMEFYPKKVELSYRTNTELTVVLVRAAIEAGIRHFVHISTTEVIAPTGTEPADELTAYHACNEYGKSKILAEEELKNICALSTMSYTILRPSAIITPKSFGVLYQLFWAVNLGLFVFYPASRQETSKRLTFTHLSDVVKGICMVIDDAKGKNQTYILSGGSLPFKTVIEIIAKELGREKPLICISSELIRLPLAFASFFVKIYSKNCHLFNTHNIEYIQQNRIYSSEKAKKMLGWTPTYTMEEAIRETIKEQIKCGALKTIKFSVVSVVLVIMLLAFFIRIFFI
ncbi:sterol-4-alpha-carboxylate 3-dehydrogenase, decarboxylating-like [Schistocerca gregaria]|uniref:sterol-4-alpha-carboxylate 3-dehydrogenase, decarboxylating-like n=1 Tax=Schistocerca gregaria TaxID=7010 RepID=UPI00211F3074|nr:sterol-4-alpha-carboxylate 3-dehydrogenase, decarboxylating-like [Schistocerca gregaria]